MFEIILSRLGYVLATVVVVWSCVQTLNYWHNTQYKLKNFIQIWLQLLVYYVWLWVAWLWFWAMTHGVIDGHLFYWVVLILATLYLYMVKIEPNRLIVHKQTIDLGLQKENQRTLTIAVVSDIHIGLFFSQHQLTNLVEKLNQLSVDAVFITGDWLYYAGADLTGKLMILKALNKPCYTVLSESDGNAVNNNTIENLKHSLKIANVNILDEKDVNLAGLNIYGATDGTGVAKWLSNHQQKPSIVLVHDIKMLQANPQTLVNATDKVLIVSGQTHGGQVYLPMITPYLVKAMSGIDTISGLRQHEQKIRTKVHKIYYSWTSTGIGMSGLPFRCGCAPSIDILTII